MLLFEKINDVVVRTVAERAGVTVQDLHTIITNETPVSLPNFYKYIQKLLKDQILIKEQGKLFLHNRWVLGIIALADKLKGGYADQSSSILTLLEGETIYHEASSIEALDGVWGDWMLQINKLYGSSESSFVYQARPYYALGMHSTEMTFFKAANDLAPVYFLSGNTTFLDKYGTEEYKKIGISALATDNLPFLKNGYCTTVVGSYVFEVLYPREISDYFDIFFESITDFQKFKPELFYRIFTMKANCKLTVRKDTIQAGKIKDVFVKTFKKENARLKGNLKLLITPYKPLRTTPPRIKLYEALGAVADERITREKTEDGIISAKVYSSSRGKYYTVTYDPTHHAIMANDNGSYRQGYLGYPSITLLMKIGILPIYKNVFALLKNIQRKDINQANHNDFEKTIATIDNMLVRQGVDLVAFTQYIDELHASIDALHLHHLGEKILPPEGY